MSHLSFALFFFVLPCLKMCSVGRASCVWIFKNVQPLWPQLGLQRCSAPTKTTKNPIFEGCSCKHHWNICPGVVAAGMAALSLEKAHLLFCKAILAENLSKSLLDNLALMLPCMRWSQDPLSQSKSWHRSLLVPASHRRVRTNVGIRD